MHEENLNIQEGEKPPEVTERTLCHLVQEKKTPAFKVGASWPSKHADVDTWIETQRPGMAHRPSASEEV